MVDTGIMNYEITGSGSGSPIVLVPGGLSGWASWKPHAEILSKRHTVVRVQLVNMAAAEKGVEPPSRYSLKTESSALGNTINKLGFKKINLVGWSHGGEVSLDYALNNTDRIATLTLIEPAAYWVLKEHGAYAEEDRVFEDFIKSIKRPVSEEDLIRFLKSNGLVPPGVEPKQMPRWPLWNSLKVSLLSIHTVLEHTDDLKRLIVLRDVPTLLVKGEESRGANSNIVELLSKDLGVNVRMLVLPDGHASHIVAQDKFVDELEKFVENR